ncbi:MAG TPA: D-amino acid aminotransferase [Chromatiales bacterium]|nr:D-amino acid aminotransferase [Chromatiales bacterium]
MAVVYLNGEYMPEERAAVSPLDRGFIFGDGVYEVIPVYNGHLFRIAEHLRRLDDSLDGVRIPRPCDHGQWAAILHGLIERNGGGNQSLYLQVTRGVARRDHAFPMEVRPTVFAMSSPLLPLAEEIRRHGVAAVTLDDNRWENCHLKTIALLPNILLRQQALDAGGSEAILIRRGEVTEGAASNLFMVDKGRIVTPPKGPGLLPGITRDLIVELARKNDIPVREHAITPAQLAAADEIWLTSSTREIVPVTRLDGAAVGDGRPGALWKQITRLFESYKSGYAEPDAGDPA